MEHAEEEEDDLESYWKLLRPAPCIKVASGKVSNLSEGLELAALKAERALLRELDKDPGKLTFTPIPELVSICIQTLLKGWLDGIHGHGPASLVEILLEDQRLPPGELKGFVRALPQSLILRILQGAPHDVASGIYALLAVEAHFRKTAERDYELRRNGSGVLIVTLEPTETDKAVVFQLDENFNLGG